LASKQPVSRVVDYRFSPVIVGTIFNVIFEDVTFAVAYNCSHRIAVANH